jgi:hypothetical protein
MKSHAHPLLYRFRKNAHFAKHCGIGLEEVSEGYAKAKMVISDYHIKRMSSGYLYLVIGTPPQLLLGSSLLRRAS